MRGGLCQAYEFVTGSSASCSGETRGWAALKRGSERTVDLENRQSGHRPFQVNIAPIAIAEPACTERTFKDFPLVPVFSCSVGIETERADYAGFHHVDNVGPASLWLSGFPRMSVLLPDAFRLR